jgi:hypothetical protein
MDGGGIAVPLFIVFLVLKLANVTAIAHWSWWWVFAPLWVDAALTVLLLAVFAVFGLAGFGLLKRRNRRYGL